MSKEMTSKFKMGCYHRVSLTNLFSQMQENIHSLHYVIGVEWTKIGINYSISGEMVIWDDYEKQEGILADLYFKTVTNSTGVTLLFRNINGDEGLKFKRLNYPGSIAVEYPENVSDFLEPYFSALEPDNVISNTVVQILHATIKDFIENTGEEDSRMVYKEDGNSHGLTTGFRFKFKDSKTIDHMIYGVQNDKLVFFVAPKKNVDPNDFVIELNQDVFITDTLYQYIDSVVTPA